jgi:hypothetical protein
VYVSFQGQSKEYGFVEFAFPSQALAALKDLEKQHEAAKRYEQGTWGERAQGAVAYVCTVVICPCIPPTGGRDAAAHLLDGPGCMCIVDSSM